MFSPRVPLLITLVITLASPFPIPAQTQERTQKTRKPQATLNREADELRSSAISVLHSLSQSANELDDLGERVRVLAEIGDAFWTIEPEQGRAVLIRAFKEIDKLSAASQSDAEKISSRKQRLRRFVLERIARREPSLVGQLVRDLPREIPTADEKARQLYGIATSNAEALLDIAEGLIASDPRRAAATASHSLQEGLSQRLRYFLIRLRARDSAVADVLVGAAVQKAAEQHPARLFDVMVLWDYAYQPPNFYLNGVSWNRERPETRHNTALDLRRSVLAFAVNAIVENLLQLTVEAKSPDERNVALQHVASLHSVIQQLLPTMQADLPQGAVELQQALARVEQELKTAGQSIPSRPPATDSDSNVTTVDSLLERAADAPQGELRDSLYLAASFNLMQSNQYQRARDVAAKIDDAERRAMILEPLNFSMVGYLVEKNRLQEALSVADQLKMPALRVGSLVRIGRAFNDARDPQNGLATLNTAQALVGKADPTIELSAATLRLAAAFSQTDQLRLSEAITLAIHIINKTQEAETPWTLMRPASIDDSLGLVTRGNKDGGVTSIEFSYPSNGGLIQLLSKLDFNQGISLAKSINRKALSLAAQAAICRAAVESTQSKEGGTGR